MVGSDRALKGRLLETLTDCTKGRSGGRGVLDACSLVAAELGTVARGNEPEQGVMAIELLGRVPVPASALVGLLEPCLLPDSPLRAAMLYKDLCSYPFVNSTYGEQLPPVVWLQARVKPQTSGHLATGT